MSARMSWRTPIASSAPSAVAIKRCSAFNGSGVPASDSRNTTAPVMLAVNTP